MLCNTCALRECRRFENIENVFTIPICVPIYLIIVHHYIHILYYLRLRVNALILIIYYSVK